MKKFEDLLKNGDLFDSHCHMDFFQNPNYAGDKNGTEYLVENVIQRALEADVKGIVNVATNVRNLDEEFKNPIFINAVGIHPEHFIEGTELSKQELIDDSILEDRIKMMDELLVKGEYDMVGECGLDYYWIAKLELDESKKNRSIEIQKKALKMQLELAKKYDLYVSLHTRDSFEDAFELVETVGHKKVIFHSFTGTMEQAIKIHENGYFYGVNGIVTYSKAQEIRDMLKAIMGNLVDAKPIDFYNNRVLFETDAPLLRPSNANTKLNEPVNISKIYEFCRRLLAKP